MIWDSRSIMNKAIVMSRLEILYEEIFGEMIFILILPNQFKIFYLLSMGCFGGCFGNVNLC